MLLAAVSASWVAKLVAKPVAKLVAWLSFADL